MKFFIGVLLLGAGILVGWYFAGNRFFTYSPMGLSGKTKVTPTPMHKKTASGLPLVDTDIRDVEKGGSVARFVVTYTDSGFAPSPLSVNRGATVTFVNESKKFMLVASAVYPSHQLLPDFVQKTQVGKGGTYEYTFATIGTWKYQNDVYASDAGSIAVLP